MHLQPNHTRTKEANEVACSCMIRVENAHMDIPSGWPTGVGTEQARGKRDV
jgi:hypothetical protein